MLLIIILLTSLLYLLPGALLHMRLREHGLSLPVCLGLGLSGLIVVDVWLASLFNYQFWLQLAANAALLGAAAVTAWPRARDWLGWLKAQWPWPAVGWLAAAAFFLVPAFVVHVPFDTDAQGFGLLAVTVRLGGSITDLSPFWPEIDYLYSPAFYLLAAQLSDLLGGPSMPVVLLGLSHTLALVTAGGVYAVGREFGDSRIAGWAAVFSIFGYALFSTLMDAAYTNILGNCLTASIMVLVFRAARQPGRLNIALAVVSLASLPIAHPDSIIHLLMAYVPFYFTIWLARTRPTRHQYLALTVVVPALAIGLCLPWIVRVLPLVGGIDVHERQSASFGHIQALLQLNGYLPPLLALGGLALALKRRRWIDLWMLGWAVAILEVSSLGNLDALSRRTEIDPMQIFYPFGVAWHATIIPVPFLAATALCAIGPLRQWSPAPRLRLALSAAFLLASVGAGLLAGPIVRFTKGRVSIVGALSSTADVQAMQWLRENSPPDAFILNYPGIEGDWAPVVAERKTVQFREQLFYIGAQPAWALQEALFAAYHDPASADSERLIRAAGVDYVLVPQVIGRPDSFEAAMRWRPPFIAPMQSTFAEARYLELAADFDGAQIWRVR